MDCKADSKNIVVLFQQKLSYQERSNMFKQLQNLSEKDTPKHLMETQHHRTWRK